MVPQLTREAIIQRLLDPGVIAVVRARNARQVPALAEALVAGGVIAVEVTMTTPNALDAIRATAATLGPCGLVGVGTVLDAATAAAAIAAGAQFVVSPICRTDLIAVAHAAGKPVMLGAYTPTEAQQAHEAGADFVKLFPADGLGAGYVKALRAPLPHLRLVPTGGVDLETIPALVQAGCVAVGAGSSLVSAKILEAEDWPQLTRLAGRFVETMRSARAANG
jgi:2-dehydro-3-deoxyphosphogluconate aldolase/(4S)-4-hydroxy-2-oxoglutarate aldolase